MPPRIRRFFSLLLIPCLLAQPGLAAVISPSLVCPQTYTPLFQQQALAERLTAALEPGTGDGLQGSQTPRMIQKAHSLLSDSQARASANASEDPQKDVTVAFEDIPGVQGRKIAVVTVKNPGKLNALDPFIIEELIKAAQRIQSMPEVAGVILAGDGRSFAAGADIEQLIGLQTRDDVLRQTARAREMLQLWETIGMKMPVVPVIGGPALGGGFEWALSGNYRIMAEGVKSIGLPEITIDVIPGYEGEQRLVRLMIRKLGVEEGVREAAKWLLTGAHHTAQEALDVGVADEVVADPMQAARDRIAHFAKDPSDLTNPLAKAVAGQSQFLFERNQGLSLSHDWVSHPDITALLEEEGQKPNNRQPLMEELLQLLSEGTWYGFDHGSEAEAEAFADIMASPGGKKGLIAFENRSRKKKGLDPLPDPEPTPLQAAYANHQEHQNHGSSAAERLFRAVVQTFVQKRIVPRAAELDEHNDITRILDLLDLIAQPLYPGGPSLLAAAFPASVGGYELGAKIESMITEELARGSQSVALIHDVRTALTAYPLLKFGTDEQKLKVLRPLLEGKKFLSYGQTEPEAGSNVANAKTTYQEDPSNPNHYLIRGQKVFNTVGVIADYALILARQPGTVGTKGLSWIIVPLKDEKGNPFPGVRVDHSEMTGHHATGTATVFLDNVSVPKENLLGSEGAGMEISLRTLENGRISISSIILGSLETTLEELFKEYQKRLAAGEKEKDLQELQSTIYDLMSDAYSARLLLRRATENRDRGMAFNLEAALTKLKASTDAVDYGAKAMALIGPESIRVDHPMERAFRDNELLEIGEGTTQIMRRVVRNELSADQGFEIKNNPDAFIKAMAKILPGLDPVVQAGMEYLLMRARQFPDNLAQDLPTSYPRERVERRMVDLYAQGVALQEMKKAAQAMGDAAFLNDLISRTEKKTAAMGQQLIHEADRIVQEFKAAGETDNLPHINIDADYSPDLLGDLNALRRRAYDWSKDKESNSLRELGAAGALGMTHNPEFVEALGQDLAAQNRDLTLGVLAEYDLSMAVKALEQEKAIEVLTVDPRYKHFSDALQTGRSAGTIANPARTSITAEAGAFGDLHYDLTGSAQAVVNGLGADQIIVFANVAGHGLTAFLVLKTSFQAQAVPHLGLNEAGIADLTFHHAAAAVLGDLGGGQEIWQAVQAVETSALHRISATSALRNAREGIDYATNQREQFRRKIIKFGQVRELLHESLNEIEAMLPASTPRDEFLRLGYEVAHKNVQVHGGSGYDRQSKTDRFWRDAQTLRVLYGDAPSLPAPGERTWNEMFGRPSATEDSSVPPESTGIISVMDREKQEGRKIAELLRTPLTGEDPRYLQGGYKQDGYGVPSGAAIDGSHAFEGSQGYYTPEGMALYKRNVQSIHDFIYRKRAKPFRYFIKIGIGGQHTPFQGIADAFQVLDKNGKVVGEYELGKDFSRSINDALRAMGATWDQVLVIPSSKSGSTDETMTIFSQVLHAMAAQARSPEFADRFMAALHDVNFVDGKERPGKELFKTAHADGLIGLVAEKTGVPASEVKSILASVLDRIIFETTNRPDQSRLSAFIQNSGLDKDIGEPTVIEMFDNVGGRWTGDLHMMLFLALHNVPAGTYAAARRQGIEAVRNDQHEANRIADRLVDEQITDIMLLVPDDYFWFGKSDEQNFNESIWQNGFMNVVTVRLSDFPYQAHHYRNNPHRAVINLTQKDLSGQGFAVLEQPDVRKQLDSRKTIQAAIAFADLFSLFYGITNTVGTRLIARALLKEGESADNVNLNDLDALSTKIVQSLLFLRQPFVELGKKLLEKRLGELQEKEKATPGAIKAAEKDSQERAARREIVLSVEDTPVTLSLESKEDLLRITRSLMAKARREGRKFVPFIYLEGKGFMDLRDALIKAGIEWVMQGTGDQHISYQQVLAQPQKFLPFIISVVPEQMIPGLPAVGFTKAYADNISPNLMQDYFAEASFRALVEERGAAGGKGAFLRILDRSDELGLLREIFLEAAGLEGLTAPSNRAPAVFGASA